MIRMFVRHTVADFDAWKRGYDSFDAARNQLGVRDAAVFRGSPNATDVTVWHDFDDMSAAQKFVGSDELKAAMENAGVVGEPEIWFVERERPG